MTDGDIKNLISEIVILTNENGYNYEITLGFDRFNNCNSLKEFQKALKSEYNEVNPDEFKMTPTMVDEFWHTIDFAFNYRGGEGSGLKFENTDEIILTAKQEEYKAFLKQLIIANSNFYTLLELKGIPGYPVWWSYRFVIDNGNGDFLFIFGSASD